MKFKKHDLYKLNRAIKFEYIRTQFTSMDPKSFYAYVKRQEEKVLLQKKLNKLFDCASTSSIVILGCINPLYGLLLKGGVAILANEEVKGKIINKISEKWQNLPIMTKRAIVLGVGLTTATSVVLITAMLFNQDTGRGGINVESLVKGPKFFGLKGGLKPYIGENFCDHVINYASRYRYSPDFVPPNPFEVDYGAINHAIFKISEQIANNQPIEMSQMALYVLLNMCSKTTF